MIADSLSFQKQRSDRLVQIEQSPNDEIKSDHVISFVKYWTGVTDLQLGFKKVRNKEYQQGVFHFLKGAAHIAVFSVFAKILLSPSSGHFLRGSSSNSSNNPSSQENDMPDQEDSQLRRDFLKPSNNPSFQESDIPDQEHAQLRGGSSNPHSTHLNSNCYSDSRTLGPIPDVQPTQQYNYCEGQEHPITIVTAYNDSIKDYAEPILENQRAYAEKHKYCYAIYQGDLAHDKGNPRAPYWSKIVAIWDQWNKAKPGGWIVWMDASAIVTNTEKRFEEIIAQYGRGKKDVIVTDEPQVPINNAVFAFKKNDWTHNWIQQVWSRCDLSQGGEGRCWGTKVDPGCHFEQESMTGLWEDNQDVKDHTSLISNRKMNSFYRFSHRNSGRNNRYLDYNGDDKEKYHWHYGDLICKVTGMVGSLRTKMTQFVLDNCIDKTCTLPQTEEEVFAYSRPW